MKLNGLLELLVICCNFFHILWSACFFQGKIFPLLYHVQVELHEKVKIWTKGIQFFKTEVDWNIFIFISYCMTLRTQIFKFSLQNVINSLCEGEKCRVNAEVLTRQKSLQDSGRRLGNELSFLHFHRFEMEQVIEWRWEVKAIVFLRNWHFNRCITSACLILGFLREKMFITSMT